jgi:hypothetical protein
MHVLEKKYSIGHINDIMKVLYTTNKGKLMDKIQKFHIYKETHNNNQINDKNTVKPNAIFDIIVRENTDRTTLPPSHTLPKPVSRHLQVHTHGQRHAVLAQRK